MDSRRFSAKIEDLRGGFKAIYAAFEQIPDFKQEHYSDLYSLLRTTLAEFETTLEELSVADEELRQQNEELIQTRQAVEDERRRYQELFNFAPHGYLATNGAGKILEANRAASLLLNVPPEYLIGSLLVIYINEPDKKLFRQTLNQLSQNRMDELTDWEIRIKPQRAEPFIVSLTVRSNQISHDGDYLRWMMRDITASKQMQSELDEMRRRLIERVEEERLHLARELHDGPVQDLYALTYRLASLGKSFEADESLAQYARIRTDLQRVIDALRTRSSELRPPTLSSFGIDKAIQSYTDNLLGQNPGLEVSLNLDVDGKDLSERAQLALFRIYQHGLVNILRHADANKVMVYFTDADGEVQLSIQDDGKGFEVPRNWIQLARQGHLGLVDSMERAAAVGGDFEVISAPGKGTTVKAVIPKTL